MKNDRHDLAEVLWINILRTEIWNLSRMVKLRTKEQVPEFNKWEILYNSGPQSVSSRVKKAC